MRKEVKIATVVLGASMAFGVDKQANAQSRILDTSPGADGHTLVLPSIPNLDPEIRFGNPLEAPQTPDFQQIEATPTPSFMVETQVPGGRVRLYPNAGENNNIYAEVAANTQFRVRGKLNTQSAEGGNEDYWFLVELADGKFGWINQLVVPQALEQLDMVPDLIDVVQMPVMQNGQILLDQQGIPQRLLEVNYALGGTIDMARLASVWGDPSLPPQTYNFANLAVADTQGEVIMQIVDIPRSDGGVNPAGSVLLLPEVTLPDGSTNVQPLYLNKADIEADLGVEINFDTTNTVEGSIRLTSSALFRYDKFAQDQVSGVNVNTAFYQNLFVSVEGDFPNSSFSFNATRLTFTTGEIYDLSLGEDGYWVAVRAAAVEFNLATDRYTWGEQVSARHVEGTTYELTIGGKVLRVDYPQGLPFGTESRYLLSNSNSILNVAGIYLGQRVPSDHLDQNEFSEVYIALPTESGQCLVLAVGAAEFHLPFLHYTDTDNPRYRTSPGYTAQEFGDIISNNLNLGDLVSVGMMDLNNIDLGRANQEYLSRFQARYGLDSADRAEVAVRNLLNQQPGSCNFLEAGSLLSIMHNPLLAPRVTSHSS